MKVRCNRNIKIKKKNKIYSYTAYKNFVSALKTHIGSKCRDEKDLTQSNFFSDYSGMKIEVNYKKKIGKVTDVELKTTCY